MDACDNADKAGVDASLVAGARKKAAVMILLIPFEGPVECDLVLQASSAAEAEGACLAEAAELRKRATASIETQLPVAAAQTGARRATRRCWMLLPRRVILASVRGLWLGSRRRHLC